MQLNRKCLAGNIRAVRQIYGQIHAINPFSKSAVKRVAKGFFLDRPLWANLFQESM